MINLNSNYFDILKLLLNLQETPGPVNLSIINPSYMKRLYLLTIIII